MAFAMLSTSPEETKRLLDEAPSMKHSPVGLMILAFADFSIVATVNQHDAAMSEKTVRDFEYVRFLFRNTPASLSHHVFALALAAKLAHSEGRTEDANRFIEEGRPLAAELMTKVDDYPAGAWSCQHFYEAAGEKDEAWRAICRVGRCDGTYSWFLAAECLNRFKRNAIIEFDEAVDVGLQESKYIKLARAFLLGWVPERHGEITDLVIGMLDDPSPFIRRHALLAMWPVWSATQIREHAEPTLEPGLWYDEECLQYLAGEGDNTALLEQAGKDEKDLLLAHFTLAMLCLADGEHGEATAHLQACTSKGPPGWFDYEWARGYLAIIEAEQD
jgi:hypothetical protein